MRIKVESVIIMICILFIPMWSTWDGFFPGDGAYWFWNMFKDFGELSRIYPAMLCLATIIPAVMLIIGAFANKRVLRITASAFGIVGMMIVIIKILSGLGSEAIFNFKHGDITLSTWIVFFLFVASLIGSIRIKDESYSGYSYSSGGNSYLWTCSCGARNFRTVDKCPTCGVAKPVVSVSHNLYNNMDSNGWICMICAARNGSSAMFCTKCGNKKDTQRTVPSQNGYWRCPECGKTNPTSSRVCKDCGYNK